MGKVIINEATPKNPITLAGEMVGPCYGSDTSSSEKNFKRGLNCIKAGHGRVLEYANAWFVLEGYSARVIREFYTHIGGAPTRTQASTRYIDESNFDYIIPPSVQKNEVDFDAYNDLMRDIQSMYKTMIERGIPKEDAGMILPLAMTTTVSVHMNARTLMSMAEVRLCNRTYWEYRQLMKDLLSALGEYSYEWKMLVDEMVCKCDKCGWCEEEYSCGKYPKQNDIEIISKSNKYDNIIDYNLKDTLDS